MGLEKFDVRNQTTINPPRTKPHPAYMRTLWNIVNGDLYLVSHDCLLAPDLIQVSRAFLRLDSARYWPEPAIAAPANPIIRYDRLLMEENWLIDMLNRRLIF